jgi:hypothetical protein
MAPLQRPALDLVRVSQARLRRTPPASPRQTARGSQRNPLLQGQALPPQVGALLRPARTPELLELLAALERDLL